MFKLDMAALRATAKLSANDSQKLATPLATLASVSQLANSPFSLEKPAKISQLATLATLVANNAPFTKIEVLDPDRWCWPHSSAMNTAEINTFAKRAATFNRRGLSSLDAELLADVLVTRDREGDNRRACLECRGLTGNGPYQCSPWRQAGLGGPVLARQLVTMLQRCDGFVPVADGKAKR